MSGPRLGRPPADQEVRKAVQRQTREDERKRIEVEGKLGEPKRVYGLDRVRTKRADTSETTSMTAATAMDRSKIPPEDSSSRKRSSIGYVRRYGRAKKKKMLSNGAKLKTQTQCEKLRNRINQIYLDKLDEDRIEATFLSAEFELSDTVWLSRSL